MISKTRPRAAMTLKCTLWSALVCGSAAIAGEAVKFISVNPQNVCMADGSPITGELESVGWKWQPDQGNDGVLQSIPDTRAKSLMLWVDGLKPGKAYEVFGFFWADGYGQDHPKTRAQRPAQFGTSLATLHTFDGPDQPTRNYVCAWEITPSGTAGAAYGLKATIEEKQPLKELSKLQLRHGEARLVRARLGRLRADATGKLPIFFADYPYHRPSGPAWIDGVAVRSLDVKGPLEEGWKKDTWLHLALRVGDTITIDRELKRGADINILDEEHLSPLFYAVTSTDASLVKRLLDMGADPNCPTQSATPLSAAVVLSSKEIVKLLLDAGADVPREIAPDSGTLTKQIHPGDLHPVVCAFRAGSVPILKMLLAKQKNIDVRKLMDMKSIKLSNGRDLRPRKTRFLYESVMAEHWSMAAYLIDNGYTDLGGYKLDRKLLASCVVAGAPAMPVFERLLKLDNPPLDLAPVLYRNGYGQDNDMGDGRQHDGYRSSMLPNDALSAAVWAGNVQLAKRLLPHARYAPLANIETLFMTAAHAQDQVMLDTLKSQFRRVHLPRWHPTPQSDNDQNLRDEDLRVFLPRTTAPPARPDRQSGEYVLGVISSPGAEGPGILLTAAASSTKGWKAVDREMIETALLENDFDKPWLKGEHQLSPLGDRLSADALVVVDKIKGDKESLYLFEVVEVATGLVIHREHLLASKLDPQKDLGDLLKRTTRALDAAARNKRRQAITLLSFSARGDLPNDLALAKVLQATIQRQVDSTPGLISLTRSQSARLIEEQVMQGKNSIWGAAHLVEGSVSPADKPNMIKVSLRLETLGADHSSVKTDSEAIGNIRDPQLVITAAWQKLFSKTAGILNDGKLTAQDNDTSSTTFAKEEAKRLLREAEWLMNAHMAPEKIEPLIVAAIALGGSPKDTIRIHLDYLFRRIVSLSGREVGRPNTAESLHTRYKHLLHLPVTLNLSDRMCHELPLARELLHQASYYFSTHGDNLLSANNLGNHRDNEFWLTINALSYMRAAIYPDHLPESSRNDFMIFGQELDTFTKKYYEVLATKEHPNIGRSVLLTGGDRWILKRNPELYCGLVQTTRRLNRINQFFPRDFDKHHGGTQLARDILATMEGDTSPKAELFKADIRCYLASADEAPLLARRFIAAAMNFSSVAWYKLYNSDSAAVSMISQHTPTSWFDWTENASGTLPTLVHNPRPSPEAIRKPKVYLNTNYYRSGLPQPMNTRVHSLGSSKDEYDMKMQAAVTRKDTKRLSSLLDAIRLYHMYCGHDHQPLFEKRYRRILQQLESPKSPAPAITGSLMADFRNTTISNLGTASWFIRDQENPDLLWTFYFSASGKTLGVGSFSKPTAYSAKPETALKETWLLGINCRTGKLEIKVNLQESALKAMGCNKPAGTMGAWDMTFDQNKNSIMTNVLVVHDRNNRCYRHETGTIPIVIDKATGTVRCLPKDRKIARYTKMDTHASWVKVAGLGDDFYFVDESGYKASQNLHKKRDEERAISIYRMDSEMKLSPLIEHGRRPAITPFDGPKTLPTEIVAHDNRLLVYNDILHAYFNPRDGSWEIIKNHHAKFGFKMFHFARRELHRHMDPIHNIQTGGIETGWKINFKKLRPDKLWFEHDELGAVELPVQLDIPKDFRESTTFVVNEPVPVKKGSSSRNNVLTEKSFDEYTKKNPLHVVVLNQTKDSLILGLQLGSRFMWQRPSRQGMRLPFLWKVSKKEVLGKLASGVSTEKAQ
jgi:hypothetical protein